MLPTGAPLAPAGADMSEVHNVGEIWAETLFEAYTNLIDANRAATRRSRSTKRKRHMADYVVAGMKAAPAEPTFVEQRDAILAAVYATKRMDDFSAIAKGFADRGLGVAAVAPPITSTTSTKRSRTSIPRGGSLYVNAKLDDSGSSCDHDGNLDANESGKLTVEVRNAGWLKLTKTQVTATTTNADFTFANGGKTEVVSIDPFGTATLSVGITAKVGATKRDIVPFVLTMTDSDAINPSSDATFNTLYNFDENKGTSATDDVESTTPVWTMTHMPKLAADTWSRRGDATNHVWHADDVGVSSDEALVSPDLNVGTDPFTISFRHRYSFELAALIPTLPPNQPIDGGVLEISVAGARLARHYAIRHVHLPFYHRGERPRHTEHQRPRGAPRLGRCFDGLRQQPIRHREPRSRYQGSRQDGQGSLPRRNRRRRRRTGMGHRRYRVRRDHEQAVWHAGRSELQR